MTIARAINTATHQDRDFFKGTLDTGATGGAGALVEVNSATLAPHSPQYGVPGTSGLPHIIQKLLIFIST